MFCKRFLLIVNSLLALVLLVGGGQPLLAQAPVSSLFGEQQELNPAPGDRQEPEEFSQDALVERPWPAGPEGFAIWPLSGDGPGSAGDASPSFKAFADEKAASEPAQKSPGLQPVEPPLPPDAPQPGLPAGVFRTPEGIWARTLEFEAPEALQPLHATIPNVVGGPDDFGYTWIDTALLSWINATDGTDTGMSGGSIDQRVGPIPLPFRFKYYENVYDSVYIAASGYIAFTDEGTWPWQGGIPSPQRPNTVVAPYWAPFDLAASGPAGRVYYKSGGTTPNRYFVVEWHQVTGGDDDFTFEVILFENGDILFQYLGMVYRNNDWWCGSIGIEDSKGQDGLSIMSFCEKAPGHRAVRITRPGPAARLGIYPLTQGRHVYPGEWATFQVPIRNTGELGDDIYNFEPISSWPVQLLRADGVTPLTDTNGDGAVDTGSVPQGGTITIMARVQTPVTSSVGAFNTLKLVVYSVRDSSKHKTVLLQTAVPAPFAQVYMDGADRAMSLYLAQPAGQAVRKATADGYQGGTLAVAETPGGNFVYVWRKGRWVSNVWVDELEYAVLDRFGNVVKPPARLADLSGATVSTYDGSSAVAAAPNGRVGVFWSRYLRNDATSQFNYNLYFAVLDDEGNVAVAPTNITNNDIWGRWSDLNVPRFYSPRIAAVGNNRFILSWHRAHEERSGWVDNIWYMVRGVGGQEIKGVTPLTNDTPGWSDQYRSPTVTSLSGDRALVAFERGGSYGDIYYVVLDGSGNVVRSMTNLSNDALRDWGPLDAVQLTDGKTLVAWTSDPPQNPGEQGWTARYYNNSNLSEPAALVRTDPTIDFHWGLDSPAPGIGIDWFSVRWEGIINVPEGTYEFVMSSDDGSRLWIDGRLVMDHWHECCQEWRAVVRLSAGRHWVKMEMYENQGGAAARLRWYRYGGPTIRYALLDGTYDRVAGPTTLDTPAAITGSSYVSVAADGAGRGIITWLDNAWGYRRHLFYALVDSAGVVLTLPMIFRTSQAVSPYIETSFEGYGNTSYRWTPPAGVDAFISAASPLSGTVGGYAVIPITYGNRGSQVAGNVQIEATLPSGLTYELDTTGVSPTLTGNRVRWSLPDLPVLAQPQFVLYLRVAGDVPPGARLSVPFRLTTTGTETNPADNGITVEVVASAAPGGPDGYGYIWDDAAPFDWVDATVGENTGITGVNQTGLVDIGFPFRFYDQTWTQVYVSTNGILVFGQDSHGCCGRVPMPLPGSPNNVIAPYWTDLAVGPPYNNGAIYVRRGGQAPKRYLAVAWHNVTPCCGTNSTDYKTFEVLLHENGDITFMYHTLQGWSGNPSVGIEDSTGYDGLQYTGTPAPGKAIRFFRPGPAARVRVTPPHQGQFARLGGSSTFTVPIQNTGELGSDTYDLTVTSTWPVTLYAADGVTPLADTDGDGKADTGPIAEGAGITVTVKVQTPPGAQVGSHNAAALTVGSSLDGSKQRTVTLQTAVPAPFVQGYHDASGGVVGLHLVRPEGNGARRMGNLDVGNFSAVAEIPGGGFVVIWNARRCPDSSCRLWVYEIFYSLVNVRGETIKAPTKLSDHTGVTVSTYDLAPAVAVLPNGTIGLVWYRYLYNPDTFQRNYNIYFAALDTAGHVVIPARNLTNNNTWGTWSDLNVPSFYYPRIAATEDNRFVLAWTRAHRESSGWVTDVWYLVLNANGGVVKPETRLTNDTPGDDDNFYAPALAALSGRQAFLAFERGGRYSDIYAVVLNSSGIVVAPRTNLSRDGEDRWDWGPDAVQIADGRVVVAWTSGIFPDAQIRFAVVDLNRNLSIGPVLLNNPAAPTGDAYPSVTADGAGRAVITWMDYHWSYRRHLYYALVNGDGTVLTPPTLFRTGAGLDPYLNTSYEGYGNTTWSWMPPTGVDAVLGLGVSPVWGSAGGETVLDVRYANYGLTVGTDVMLVATLDGALGYVGDTSGITPIVNGNTLTWHLPDLAFLDEGGFELRLRLPMAAQGSRYPVQLTLTTAGPEVVPADNAISTQVGILYEVRLPLLRRQTRP